MINLRRINLNLLTFFEALYQEQNLTAAAQRINVSQPTMSNALSRLRGAFNDQLFVRTGHTMEPTPRARRLAPSILEALARIREGMEDKLDFDLSVPRTFNIGGIDHVDLIAIPQLVQRNAATLSTIHFGSVSITGTEYEEHLRSNKVDLVIDVQAPRQPQLQVEPVLQRQVVPMVRVGHPMAGKKVSPDDLTKLKYAVLSHRHVARGLTVVETCLRDHDCLENVAVRVSHIRSVFGVVRNTDLVGFFPEKTAGVEKNQLVPLEVDLPKIDITHYMIWHEFQTEDAGHQWLRKEVKEIYDNVEKLPDTYM